MIYFGILFNEVFRWIITTICYLLVDTWSVSLRSTDETVVWWSYVTILATWSEGGRLKSDSGHRCVVTVVKLFQ